VNQAEIRALPKADIHLHAESLARLGRLVARRRGLGAYDHAPAVERIARELPPGIERLIALDDELKRDGIARTGYERIEVLDDQPDYVQARFEMTMEEAASQGALLVEMRIGSFGPYYPHLISSFRAAEKRVRSRYPNFHAEPIIAWFTGRPTGEAEVARTLDMAPEGIAGIDLYIDGQREDVATIYRWAERARAAGLGVTCHAGEFVASRLRAALEIPGLTRLGHAVQAVTLPGMLDELRRRDIVVEVALTCNLVLGAVPSLEEHPIRRFCEAGVRVTIATDDPVRVNTSLMREYEVAAGLGFSQPELLNFTRNGIRASFTTPERKLALMAAIDAWEAKHRAGEV
jgi:adenosine deaminase